MLAAAGAAWHIFSFFAVSKMFQDVPRLQLSSSCPRAQLLGARWAADASLLLPRVAEAEFQQVRVFGSLGTTNWSASQLVLKIAMSSQDIIMDRPPPKAYSYLDR